MTIRTDDETYLGDGLYVSFDGWHVRLRAPRPDGDHWVALEPEIYRALRHWIKTREVWPSTWSIHNGTGH